MDRGLEALEKIHDHWNCCNPNSNGCDEKDFDVIELELVDGEKNKQALEIIKAKLPPLMRSALLDYCNKEEYDLLKEVLL